MASYVTTTEANTYFAQRYPADEWNIASVMDRQAALSTATRLMNQLNYAGVKTDPLQVNEFPRNTFTDIPEAVKLACYEITYALLDGHNVEYDSENHNILRSKFGGAETTKQPDTTPMHLLHNIPSSQAWNYLRPYLINTQTLKIERTS